MMLALSLLLVIATQDSPVTQQETAQHPSVKLAEVFRRARAGIHSGTIRIRLEYEWLRKNTSFNSQVLFAFDGDRIRFDNPSHVFDRDGRILGVKHTIRGRNCIESNFEMEYTNSSEFPDANRGVIFTELSISAPGMIPDPRLLGYVPCMLANLGEHSFQLFTGQFENATITEERQPDGEDLLRVSFKDVRGTNKTWWIAPKKGYNPVKVAWDGGGGRDIVSSKLRFHANAQVWFPESLTVENFLGDEVQRRQVLDVLDIELNSPPDPQLFTFAGMEVPAGTRVARLTAGKVTEFDTGETVWNGEQEVDSATYQQQLSARQFRFRIALSIFAGCIGLLLAIFARKTWKRTPRHLV